MFLTAEIVGVTSLSLVALSVVLEAAGSSSRLSEARDDPHLNSKRIDRLSALLASVTHRDHTDTHTHSGKGQAVHHSDERCLGCRAQIPRERKTP